MAMLPAHACMPDTAIRSSCTRSHLPSNRFKIFASTHAAPSSTTERLWKEYFLDPSQWWDNRYTKDNPRYPDFKHRITKEPLWIDGWNNPSWVKDMLEKMASLSKDMNSPKEYCGWEVLGLEEALTSLERMAHPPSVHILTCILLKCRRERHLAYSLRLYNYICKCGLDAHRSLGNYLVPMLVDVGSIYSAQQVLDMLVDRNEHSWTALITGYLECGESQHALNLYQKMQEESVQPSGHTFVALLKACGKLKDGERGQELHDEVAKKGLLDRDPYIGNALVGMYAECGLLEKALDVFRMLPVRDVVSWNALITWYVEHGLGQDALECFEKMQLDGISPDAITFVCSLKACGSLGAIDKGREIHAQIARKGLLERNPLVGSTLVDMYAKCGSLAEARDVFDKLPVRDAILWTALIAGYAEHGPGQEALVCFEQMQLEAISPDAVTFICSLKACGSIGDIDKGRKIHTETARRGLLENDPFVGSTLVDMYAKCGLLGKALEVFNKLQVRDAVSYNALITGYAHLGESENVFHMLDRMRGEDIKPNGVTFLCVLSVCSHSGLVDKGQRYFEAMGKDYVITPSIEHYNCMIDLLCRAGQLDEAVAMIKKVPFTPTLVVWHALLGACQKWSNVELGRWAFEHAVQLDQKNAAAYVLMSNIYADAHMQHDAKKVEEMRVKAQAWKKPGQSWWIDLGGVVHSFLVEDMIHSQSMNIYAKLADIFIKLKEEGYVPDSHWVSRNLSDNEKNAGLCGHSEKYAIAYALINTPKDKPIHVFKNLQVCNDCHSAMALISKIEQRTLLVRDVNHVHVFKEGKCACRDCW